MEQSRKRLFIDRKTNAWQMVETIKWAANNGYDAIVFSLDEKLSVNSRYIKLAKRYELIIEAGGRDFPLLLPRRLFFFHRDLFRMEHGKRKASHHFCPTNPETTAIIAERAGYLFARSMKIMTVPRVFHLLPDEKHENNWCACPACRAFTPAEQNLIAVSAAADVLARLDPDARLSFFDYGEGQEAEGIAPRGNMFRLDKIN
jgi:hypothetical protein